MAVTYNRYKFVTVSLWKRFRNGRFTSETAVQLDSDAIVFKAVTTGVFIEIFGMLHPVVAHAPCVLLFTATVNRAVATCFPSGPQHAQWPERP
jgi:hypothetical protein